MDSPLTVAMPLDVSGKVAGFAERTLRPRSGTLLYDVVKLVSGHDLRRLPSRKMMLAITGGIDSGSTADLRATREADAVVYAIRFGDGEDGHSIIEKPAKPTGGRIFLVTAKRCAADTACLHAAKAGHRVQAREEASTRAVRRWRHRRARRTLAGG